MADFHRPTFLPLGSVLFGAFQLVDSHIATASNASASHLDFGFGSDEGLFAGCHRFSIARGPLKTGVEVGAQDRQALQDVEIRLEGFFYTPRAIPDVPRRLLVWFHQLYARLLFTDGVRGVLLQE